VPSGPSYTYRVADPAQSANPCAITTPAESISVALRLLDPALRQQDAVVHLVPIGCPQRWMCASPGLARLRPHCQPAILGHVVAELGNVLLVLEEPIADRLFEIRGSGAQLGQAIDDILNQVKPIDLVQHHHVEWRRGRALFLVATHVQVAVVRPPIGEPVDQPRVAVGRRR